LDFARRHPPLYPSTVGSIKKSLVIILISTVVSNVVPVNERNDNDLDALTFFHHSRLKMDVFGLREEKVLVFLT
jgi:hypothetical protein